MERAILFKGEMVKAILDGRKTQTRRVIIEKDCWRNGLSKKYNKVSLENAFPVTTNEYLKVPYCHIDDYTQDMNWTDEGVWRVDAKYQVGDRLWVKERVAFKRDDESEYCYFADTDAACHFDYCEWKSISPRFMAKCFARIRLEITEVRVQRVRNISEEDAKAEGCQAENVRCRGLMNTGSWQEFPLYKAGFKTLWDSINAKRGYSWESNPWVFAYSFKRI